jgi:phosphoribosylamine--glycine ligase
MRVLVVGSGGREHALVWKIADSPLVDKVFCAPGNAGISRTAECVKIPATEILQLRKFARENSVDLTVIGPEEPLVKGIVDAFESSGLRAFGPNQQAARLEGSKVFAKQLMQRHSIPTAPFRTFNAPERAKSYLDMVGPPVVVKADGLAAGKAAIVCRTLKDAYEAIDRVMIRKEFGEAGDQVVIEGFLEGEEASMIAFTDGRTIAVLPSTQDHKAVYDGDQGPNTGGMGAYSPTPVVTEELASQIEREVLVQTVHALNREDKHYRGALYAGIMVTDDGPQVLEFNCRLGDPETQPLLMRMQSDLVPVLLAALDGTLDQVDVRWDQRPALCVVMASGGYPGTYRRGLPIEGLEDAAKVKDVVVFHAGTAVEEGRVVTSGGRVLGVTARGNSIKEAKERAYEAAKLIHFERAYYRTDIGQKAIDRVEAGEGQTDFA